MSAAVTSRALGAAIGAFAVGIAVVSMAPPSWRLPSWQGILLGTALYMGVMHRWIARPDAVLEIGWRSLVFLALVAGEAYAYYEWLPASDLRAPFVMLSGWVVAESLLAPRSTEAAISGFSPRA